MPAYGQVWFADASYRDHAEVEDRVKATKQVGPGLLPPGSWQLNIGPVLAAAPAADLNASMCLPLPDKHGVAPSPR